MSISFFCCYCKHCAVEDLKAIGTYKEVPWCQVKNLYIISAKILIFDLLFQKEEKE